MNEQQFKALWKSQPLDTAPVSLETIRNAAMGFNATILRRNRQEEFAGYLVMLIFGVFAWVLESTTMRVGCILIILGAFVMLYQLRKRGAIDAMAGHDIASTYVDYFKSALERQRDALRTIWLWGVLPSAPGVAVLVWGMAEKSPSEFPWLPMLAVFLLPFGLVVYMNLRAARKMQQKIDEIASIAT